MVLSCWLELNHNTGAAPEERSPSTTGDGSQRDLVAADVQEGRGREQSPSQMIQLQFAGRRTEAKNSGLQASPLNTEHIACIRGPG